MQKHESRNTSINSTKLPAIYGKVNLAHHTVIDFGCGRYTDHIRAHVAEQGAQTWNGYDPYNQDPETNRETDRMYAQVVICSNVLNVIDSEQAIDDCIAWMYSHLVPYGVILCTVYEGDRTGTGRETQNGQSWQRNEKLSAYLERFGRCGLIAQMDHGMIRAHIPQSFRA